MNTYINVQMNDKYTKYIWKWINKYAHKFDINFCIKIIYIVFYLDIFHIYFVLLLEEMTKLQDQTSKSPCASQCQCSVQNTQFNCWLMGSYLSKTQANKSTQYNSYPVIDPCDVSCI